MVATGISPVETRDAAIHPTMHRTTSTTKSYLTQNVSSAEVEKLWSRVRKLHLKYGTKKVLTLIV